ncbi:glycosyltransferase family 4 protein [Pseudomonas schmalbachii]|nr:glycosyltransferase family 4 protein [Pseudomonas schmalbachii]
MRRHLNERQLQRVVLFCDWVKYKYFRELFPHSTPGPVAIPQAGVVPSWIVDEMRALSIIEPALYPTPELLAKFHAWNPPMDAYASSLYREMVGDFISFKPQVIFLIPHLMRGGSDLGTLHHVQLCVDRGMRVTVALTRDVVSPWVHRLPSEVRVVEFGQLTRLASEGDRDLVLLRLLLQSPAETIHLINSHLGWRLFERFSKPLISSGKRLFASVYCDDINSNGVRCGYAVEFLPKAWPHLSGVLSDNRAFIDSLHRRDGLPRELLHAVYFPCMARSIAAPSNGRRVLWASRLTAQKRPELLYHIAQSMPDVMFDVYGELDPACEGIGWRLKALSNVNLCGRYDDFSSMVSSGVYGVFLYTSGYDGLPNVLLEATAAGLPIVTATVGGIAELVDQDSGYPLDPLAGPLAFVEALRKVLAEPVEAGRRVLNAQVILRERHGWDAFMRSIDALDGYLPSPEQRAAQ